MTKYKKEKNNNLSKNVLNDINSLLQRRYDTSQEI